MYCVCAAAAGVLFRCSTTAMLIVQTQTTGPSHVLGCLGYEGKDGWKENNVVCSSLVDEAFRMTKRQYRIRCLPRRELPAPFVCGDFLGAQATRRTRREGTH